jgi:phosphate transport system substrate-binding protein
VTITLRHRLGLVVGLAAAALGLTACGGADAGTQASDGTGRTLSGTIRVDGSSTVAPLTTVAGELFQEQTNGVRVTVGTSGTGGGFEKFCAGETDISDASRPIKDEEKTVCDQKGIGFESFTVANDALSVVVNKDNDFVDCITTEQLKAIWEPGSNVNTWNQVDPKWPNEKIDLFGPGTDSGTFDYFTDVINGEGGASRTDYTPSEDDNVLVQGVAGSEGGLGYFGFSYFEENQDKLKALKIDSGSGCVAPSVETVQDGTYTPLGRPLFIYPKTDAMKRPEVVAFVEYYVENNKQIAEESKFIPLNAQQEADLQAALDRLKAQANA